MQLEVGSNFWEYSLSCHRENKFWWEEDNFYKAFFKSGRNAFKAICKLLNVDNRRILFPAYHCETESDPWYENGWVVGYYPVEKNFTVDSHKFEKSIREFKPSVVVIQSYFGFEALDYTCVDVIKKIKKSGTIIIEDITQSLLSDIRHEEVDYYVASFRKFFAITDGGVLISRVPLRFTNVSAPDYNIVLSAIKAYSLKQEYFLTKDKETKTQFRSAYVELNEYLSINDELYAMSEMGLRMLSSVNTVDISRKRRHNFEYLYNGLENLEFLELTMKLDNEMTVPLFLPVLVKSNTERAEFQEYLAKNDIYCPIIWKKSPRLINCPYESQEIYDKILCFPIDQRYDDNDMKRVIEAAQGWR